MTIGKVLIDVKSSKTTNLEKDLDSKHSLRVNNSKTVLEQYIINQ